MGCLWHAVLLYEDLPGFITERNMGQEAIADRNIFLSFQVKM